VTGRVLILGGGQIGRASALAFRDEGWRVTLAQRRPGAEAVLAGVDRLAMDRDRPGATAKALGSGVDLLIDTIAYDETHAGDLLGVRDRVGALAVISSASVYRDAEGRTLDEAARTGFPHLPTPIEERQPTVAPGPGTYSTRKVALEAALLENEPPPLAILRPGAVHGPGSRHPREWFFIKRLRDGRREVPLAFDGASRFHTTAAANIAAFLLVWAAAPRTGVFNIADPEALSVRSIGEAIGRVHDYEWRFHPFEGAPVRKVGAHPWCVARPVILSTAKAAALGYRPAVAYADALAQTCRSAEAMAAAGVPFPPYLAELFDYRAEDAWLAMRR
jgi:nucleoside-diphosphate-sugar epimerase